METFLLSVLEWKMRNNMITDLYMEILITNHDVKLAMLCIHKLQEMVLQTLKIDR